MPSIDAQYDTDQTRSTLRDSHPIFAGILERTVRKLFPSMEAFCKEVGIQPAQFDTMMQIEANGSTLRLDTLTSMLAAINKRSSMAYNALLHSLLEDIEEAVEERAELQD